MLYLQERCFSLAVNKAHVSSGRKLRFISASKCLQAILFSERDQNFSNIFIKMFYILIPDFALNFV